jgi:hypothetical protein
MNAPIISAMAALLGAAIGGLALFLASWMTLTAGHEFAGILDGGLS